MCPNFISLLDIENMEIVEIQEVTFTTIVRLELSKDK